MEIKAKLIKFDEEYNIIMIYKNETYEYYLEKIGYGNLFLIFCTKEDIVLNNGYVYEYIEMANNENFWGD